MYEMAEIGLNHLRIGEENRKMYTFSYLPVRIFRLQWLFFLTSQNGLFSPPPTTDIYNNFDIYKNESTLLPILRDDMHWSGWGLGAPSAI